MFGTIPRGGPGAALALAATLVLAPGSPPARAAPADAPLVVDASSHVVVMEYEAWWGPSAITFQGDAARPLLRSADMAGLGGGYDSADPAILQQHAAWFEDIGVDAVISEITNGVACTFDSERFILKYLAHTGCLPYRGVYEQIRDNTGNLYPAYTQLGTTLKLIPLLGGVDDSVMIRDIDGKTAFEKEIGYFGQLLRQYPGRAVIYHGKPLMLIFIGAAQDPDIAHHPLWYRIRRFLAARPDLARAYTFRMMAGYLDSQPWLWASHPAGPGPRRIDPAYGFWGWVDRRNPGCTGRYCPYFPTYSYDALMGRAENLTVSIATAGQKGWGCPDPEAPPYCPDASLRLDGAGGYGVLDGFMADARAIDPIFLIVHQFNEFGPPDEGFDAQTDDDIEPADLWGMSALEAVKRQIQAYRQAVGG